MNKKLLHYTEPTVRTYLDYAFIFGMRGPSVAYENFLLSNFGNMCFIHSLFEHVWDPFDFFPGPRIKQLTQSGVVETQGHDLWQERDRGALIEFFVRQLEEERYCYAPLDEYYIRGKYGYKRVHFIHHSLVVGIDRPRGHIALLSYLSRKEHDYGMQWIPLDEFILAFDFDSRRLRGDGQEIFATWCYKYVETFKVDPDARYDFDLESVATELESFLNSSSTPDQQRRHNKDVAPLEKSFGLAAYVPLADFMNAMQRGDCELRFHETRILWEHAAFMVEKVEFLAKNHLRIEESLLWQFREIATIANEARLLLFSAKDSRSADVFNLIQQRLSQCRDAEARAYEQLHGMMVAQHWQ